MAGDYTLFLQLEAVSVLRSLRPPERTLLEAHFNQLENFPNLKGEATARDIIGRVVQVKFVSKFRIVYWADHAVKEIKVLKLERLPRR